MTLVAFEHPDQLVAGLGNADEWLPGGKAVAAGLLRMASVASGTREKYLVCIGDAIDACRRPPHEALPLLQRAAEAVNRDRALIPPLSLSRMTPNFYRCEVQLGCGLAKTRGVITALAVERFRLANGSAPGETAALVPAFLPKVPADPFDGNPMRYRSGEAGYMVYSIGENRKDDGGAGDPKKNEDVVFRVAYPYTPE